MAAVAPYACQMHAGINDEGIVINGGLRIVAGQIPYRDFDLFYTPGSMVITALWFKVVGFSIESARWLMTLWAGLIASLIFLISDKLLSRPYAYLPPILFAISGYSEWPVLSYHWFAIAGLLLCCHHSLVWQKSKDARSVVWAGIGCGFAGACLQSEGVASFAAAVCTLLLGSSEQTWKERVQLLFIFLGGILVIWLPLVLGLMVTGAFNGFVENTILRAFSGLYHYHAGKYDLSRRVLQPWANFFAQWPSTWGFAQIAWALDSIATIGVWTVKYALLFPVTAAACILGYRAKQETRVLCLFLVFWMFMKRERLDLLYSNYLMPLWYIALVLCLFSLKKHWPKLAGVGFSSLISLYSLSIYSTWTYTTSFTESIPTASGVLWSRQPDLAEHYRELYRTAARLTPPGTRTFAWPFAASFYVLSQTINPSRLDFMAAGWQDAAQAQAVEQTLTDVQYLYYAPIPREVLVDYPNIDPDVFEREIQNQLKIVTRNYQPYARIGQVIIFRRKS